MRVNYCFLPKFFGAEKVKLFAYIIKDIQKGEYLKTNQLLKDPRAWGLIYVKAAQILKNLSWLYDMNLAGIEEHDLISKYIYRCLAPGDTFWDREKYPDPSGIIAKNAFRDVQDFFKSKRHRTKFEMGHESSIDDFAEEAEQPIDGIINDDILNRISNILSGDEELLLLLLAIQEGYTKTSDIARELDVGGNKVSKLKAKLKRKLSEVYKEWRS